MSAAFRLFERYGVELEYMIVRDGTLDVLPTADEVLKAVTGEYAGDADVGTLSWSNELVTHVIEFKTGGPAPELAGLAGEFQDAVRRVNALLAPLGGRLMPTAMHPWMDPHRETRLWPHEYNAVYEKFNEIFDCRGHGWSNLQSTHLNLPFANDEEFGRLHAAIRLVLPILPALAASSPVRDGQLTGLRDTRLEAYRHNARRVPSVAGRVIPEPVYTRAAYESEILETIWRDLAPFDAEGILRYEWANARGAIARFDRNTIEIRVLDIQECPAADLAIVRLIVATLRALVAERWQSFAQQQAWRVAPLADIFLHTVERGDEAVIADGAYLAAFGIPAASATAGELWQHIRSGVGDEGLSTAESHALDVILSRGCLARRIATALGHEPPRARLVDVYGELCACLAAGRMFGA